MTSIIVRTGGYTSSVTVTHVPALPGHFHLKFQSQLLGTRYPGEERSQFAVTTDREGLENLAREIFETLSKDAT